MATGDAKGSMHGSPAKEVPSLGYIFEALDEARRGANAVQLKSSEPYERDLATAMVDLAGVVESVLVILRDHLSCHDCMVVDHVHMIPGNLLTEGPTVLS